VTLKTAMKLIVRILTSFKLQKMILIRSMFELFLQIRTGLGFSSFNKLCILKFQKVSIKMEIFCVNVLK